MALIRNALASNTSHALWCYFNCSREYKWEFPFVAQKFFNP